MLSLCVLILNGCGDAPTTNYGYVGGTPTIDGYAYKTVKFGEQEWFAENLKTTVYRNGDAIPANLPKNQWRSTNGGALAVYEGEVLYNWYAVNDARCLCPSGWHVATDRDWMMMEMALGMSEAEVNDTGMRGTDQGTKMKTATGWENGDNGTNSSGFSGLPCGGRSHDGDFSLAGYSGYWWSSSPEGSFAWVRVLAFSEELVYRNYTERRGGYSVRCVRDAE